MRSAQTSRDEVRWAQLRLLSLVFSIVLVMAGGSPVLANKGQGIFAENGVALAGYDPVAYFTLSKPVMGSDQYTVEWQEVTWHFANPHHADLFKATPEKYAPKFGGFCALGVTYGQRMKPDLTAWEIHDGQLYLYYDPPTRMEWSEGREANEKSAAEQWNNMQTPAAAD